MDNDYCIVGQINKEGKPDGLVREVNIYGGIYEGNMTEDGNYNGWGIRYYGDTDSIYVGWWENSTMYGNGMILNSDWSINCAGWFQNGLFKEFKYDKVYR